MSGLAVFGIAIAVSAFMYTGGSWSDLHAPGFSLLENYWCDLVRSHGINGAENGSSRGLAMLAFGGLGVALFAFWRPASSILPPAVARPVLGIARLSTIGALGMVFFPSDRSPLLHGVVALAAAGCGLVGTAWLSAIRLPGEAYLSLRRSSGGATFGFALANAGLYVSNWSARPGWSWAEPSVQKLATLSLLVWMLSTLRATCGRSGSHRHLACSRNE
ncbi:MAG TPA: hypothetical protein VG963_31130 [Polyangiaceae bacterium]|nr:hypothetical protein [Polyangiaceae bacterium]